MAKKDEAQEGISKPAKVAAGAALGVAIPVVVGAARKLIGGDSDDSESERGGEPEQTGSEDRRERRGRSTSPARGSGGRRGTSKTSGKKRAAKSSGKTTQSKSRTSTSKSAGRRKKTSATGARRKKTSATGAPRRKKTSATAGRGTNRGSSTSRRSSGSTREPTREQLYRQATRLKVEGRSRMSKAQLQRAVERAKR